METLKTNHRLESWVEEQLSRGRYGFSLDMVRQAFAEQTETATKFSLKRLTDKGKVLSIHKGYYLIIPPQYLGKGILPPSLFIDAFMKFLQRPYYVALLNAAAYHGASHQQPQEFFVMTNFPVLRPTQKKGIKLNYISIKSIPEKLLEQRKTESGYIKISNPLLTAVDLVQFEKRIGGINRAATVLIELAEVIKPENFRDVMDNAQVTTLQRLGYLLDAIGKTELANALFQNLKNENASFFRIPLKASGDLKGFSSDNRWKVIVNTKIEVDE